MTTTKTASGLDVTIEPMGRTYIGKPTPEIRIHFTHPQHGVCMVVSDRYGESRGQAGAMGHGFLGIGGAGGERGKYTPAMTVTITRAEFNAAMAEAEALAVAAAEAEKVEAERKDAASKVAADAGCPAGFVPCRQAWSNGDLASACYVTEDGIEVIWSDLLESHGGWYYVPADEVETARAQANTKAIEQVRRTAERDAKRAAAFDAAKATGKAVEIDRWTEDCDGTADECSTDICSRMALPDGSTRIERFHTH